MSDNGSTVDRYRRRTQDYTDGASASAHAAADRLSALTAQVKLIETYSLTFLQMILTYHSIFC